MSGSAASALFEWARIRRAEYRDLRTLEAGNGRLIDRFIHALQALKARLK